jgi:hypothetical protein
MAAYKPTTVVVYKKSPNARKHYIKVLDVIPDKFIGAKASKYFDPSYELVEIGIGEVFLKRYKQKYKVTKIQTKS